MKPPSKPSPVDAVKPWLQSLSRRLHITDRHRLEPHNIEVENSRPDEWWIQVRHGNVDLCPRCMTDHGADSQDPFHIERMKELREALQLTTLLREIDYGGWLHEMKKTCGLLLPSDANELDEGALEPKFSFTLQGGWTSDTNVWRKQMQSLFSTRTNNQDPRFQQAFEHLKLFTGGEQIHRVVPIRLLFSHVALTLHEQVEDLRKLTETIRAIQHTTAESTVSFQFRLHSVELYLRRYELHALVLHELEQLAATGVKIHFLSLPGRVESPIDGALLSAWSRLTRALFQPPLDAFLRIERLELPAVYTNTGPFSATWLSALAHTQNIESLRIDGRQPAEGSPNSFLVELIRTLVTVKSQPSIQALHLDGFGAVPLSILRNIADLGDPASELSLRSLVIQPDPKIFETVDDVATPHVWIPILLHRIGKSLTDLALDHISLDEACIVRCIGSCPRLQSFRVSGARLHSMEVFQRAYAAGIPMMSLDLRESAVPTQKLEQFLHHTTDKASPLHRKLRGLRIGDSTTTQFTPSTLACFEKVLVSGSSLLHVHIVKSMADFTMSAKPMWSDRLAKFNGTTIPIKKAPLPTSSKIAFVQALMRLHIDEFAPEIPSDVISEIFEFAAMPSRRIVRVEHDTTMWQNILV